MLRSAGKRSLITRSPTLIAPEVTSSKPAIILSVEVLPQPDEPKSPTISPSPIAMSTASTASTGAARRDP